MKYSKEKIVKALLLAPLPLLFFTALLFIIMNREYSLYSIFVVFAGHGLVYLAYSILTVPFSFMVSILLNRYSILNLLTICISSLIIAMPFFVLFGWSRVTPVFHFFSTLMVALGAHFSAIWIIVANSWMQTPTGHAVNAAGQFVAADWLND